MFGTSTVQIFGSRFHPVVVLPSKILVIPGGIGNTPASGSEATAPASRSVIDPASEFVDPPSSPATAPAPSPPESPSAPPEPLPLVVPELPPLEEVLEPPPPAPPELPPDEAPAPPPIDPDPPLAGDPLDDILDPEAFGGVALEQAAASAPPSASSHAETVREQFSLSVRTSRSLSANRRWSPLAVYAIAAPSSELRP